MKSQEFFVTFRRFSSATKKPLDLLKLLSSMPKDITDHVERNQKHRLRIKEKSKFYSPGIVNIQILGNGARGGSTSVYIFSEQSRYLFNCSEGTQRLASEHRTKLTRMENVFLTRKTWDRFGGVPGLCLTLQDFGVPKLQLHGPPGMQDIFNATRRFVVLRHMKVEYPICEAGGMFEDSVMKVFYVPLKKESNNGDKSLDENTLKLLNDDTDYYGYENNGNGKSQKSSSPPKFVQPNVDDLVLSYICKLQERPGQLLLDKCVDFGVPKGPLLGQLKNGFDVTLPNGRVVKADDVRGPTLPGSVFIFVDVPDESYLNSLLESKAYEGYQANSENQEDIAQVIFHFTPQEIADKQSYKDWMGKFSAETKHLFVNERNEITGFFSAHRSQRRLNLIDENIFPMLTEENPFMKFLPLPENFSSADLKIEVPEETEEFPVLQTLSSYHLRPAKGFDRSTEPFYSAERLVDENFVMQPELEESLRIFKEESQKIIKTRDKCERMEEFPRFITLGTGSCIPNKTRNVSSNLIHISPETCFILDCGEGTLGQIVRFYGHDESDEILKRLKLIYISHLHADHHLGLINILNRRRKVTNDKVLILAPIQFNSWVSFYNYCIEDISETFDLCSNTDFLEIRTDDHQKSLLLERLGLTDLMTCYVRHCPHSFGISFAMKNPVKSENFPGETIKVTYSGDTMPCEELVTIGMNSDVLIHEATMEDELEDEAKLKMHSTTTQAIEIGKQMKAKFVILTHFSQRYAKIPLMNKVETNVTIGFDNMEVTLKDLPAMHLMYEPLKMMFSEHFELMEKKTAKRKFVQELREINDNLKSNKMK